MSATIFLTIGRVSSHFPVNKLFFPRQESQKPESQPGTATVLTRIRRNMCASRTIETRYNVYAINNGKYSESNKLSLYRESSLSVLNFAETYAPVQVGSGPGLFIDSSLVFGDRNYVMVWDKEQEKLYRPISLSFIIPRECISLGAYEVKGRSELVVQCFDRKTRTMNFKNYPLEL